MYIHTYVHICNLSLICARPGFASDDAAASRLRRPGAICISLSIFLSISLSIYLSDYLYMYACTTAGLAAADAASA